MADGNRSESSCRRLERSLVAAAILLIVLGLHTTLFVGAGVAALAPIVLLAEAMAVKPQPCTICISLSLPLVLFVMAWLVMSVVAVALLARSVAKRARRARDQG